MPFIYVMRDDAKRYPRAMTRDRQLDDCGESEEIFSAMKECPDHVSPCDHVNVIVPMPRRTSSSVNENGDVFVACVIESVPADAVIQNSSVVLYGAVLDDIMPAVAVNRTSSVDVISYREDVPTANESTRSRLLPPSVIALGDVDSGSIVALRLFQPFVCDVVATKPARMSASLPAAHVSPRSNVNVMDLEPLKMSLSANMWRPSHFTSPGVTEIVNESEYADPVFRRGAIPELTIAPRPVKVTVSSPFVSYVGSTLNWILTWRSSKRLTEPVDRSVERRLLKPYVSARFDVSCDITDDVLSDVFHVSPESKVSVMATAEERPVISHVSLSTVGLGK
eukprot:PhM_4_TR10499/c0_g1_i1/m.88696